jgi:hypothetical protein
MNFEFSRQIFAKVSDIKFHQNPSIGSRDVPCGQTDMTKLIVAWFIRNFAKSACFNYLSANLITWV